MNRANSIKSAPEPNALRSILVNSWLRKERNLPPKSVHWADEHVCYDTVDLLEDEDITSSQLNRLTSWFSSNESIPKPAYTPPSSSCSSQSTLCTSSQPASPPSSPLVIGPTPHLGGFGSGAYGGCLPSPSPSKNDV